MKDSEKYQAALDRLYEKTHRLSRLAGERKRAAEVFDKIRNGREAKVTVRVKYVDGDTYRECECFIDEGAKAHVNEAVNHTIWEISKRIDMIIGEA